MIQAKNADGVGLGWLQECLPTWTLPVIGAMADAVVVTCQADASAGLQWAETPVDQSPSQPRN